MLVLVPMLLRRTPATAAGRVPYSCRWVRWVATVRALHAPPAPVPVPRHTIRTIPNPPTPQLTNMFPRQPAASPRPSPAPQGHVLSAAVTCPFGPASLSESFVPPKGRKAVPGPLYMPPPSGGCSSPLHHAVDVYIPKAAYNGVHAFHAQGHGRDVLCVAVNPVAPHALASSGKDGSLRLWDLRGEALETLEAAAEGNAAAAAEGEGEVSANEAKATC